MNELKSFYRKHTISVKIISTFNLTELHLHFRVKSKPEDNNCSEKPK